MLKLIPSIATPPRYEIPHPSSLYNQIMAQVSVYGTRYTTSNTTCWPCCFRVIYRRNLRICNLNNNVCQHNVEQYHLILNGIVVIRKVTWALCHVQVMLADHFHNDQLMPFWIVFSRPFPAWPVVIMETVGQTNQTCVTTGFPPYLTIKWCW